MIFTKLLKESEKYKWQDDGNKNIKNSIFMDEVKNNMHEVKKTCMNAKMRYLKIFS